MDEKEKDVNTAVEAVYTKLRDDLTRTVKEEISALNKTREVAVVADNTIDNKTGGWKNLHSFLSDVMIYGRSNGKNCSDTLKNWLDKTRAVTGASYGTAGDGGNIVPVAYATSIDELFIQKSIVMQYGNIIPQGVPIQFYPIWGDHDHSAKGSTYNGSHGGVEIQKDIAEGEEYVAQKLAVQRKSATLHKFGVALPYTVELEKWSAPGIVSLISKIAPMAISSEFDYDALNGGAVTENVRDANCAVTVSGELTLANINTMWARQLNRQQAIWVFPDTPTVFNTLQTLSLGGTANASPVYLPGNNIAGAPFGTIYGRPVVFTENWNDVDGGGFIDFSSVYIPTGGGIEQFTSEHIRFMFDEKVVKFTFFADCLPMQYEPHTPRNGSDTKSTIVLLSDGSDA